MKRIFIFLTIIFLSCGRPTNSDDMVQIDILQKDGHDDLEFSIKGLTGDLTFDTYYFGITAEQHEGMDVKNCIAKFIGYWVTEIEKMQNGQTRYFPIDISDQYTGCIKVTKVSNDLEVNYGMSRQEGFGVNIDNPTHYFNSITDFQSDIPKSITVSQTDFINSLKNQIDKLAN